MIRWHLIAPPSAPDFSGKVGFNFALNLLLPITVIRLHVGGLHAVEWDEGPWALVTPSIGRYGGRGVGLKRNDFELCVEI